MLLKMNNSINNQKIDFLSYITDRRNNKLLNKHEEIRKQHELNEEVKVVRKE